MPKFQQDSYILFFYLPVQNQNGVHTVLQLHNLLPEGEKQSINERTIKITIQKNL